MRTKRQDGKVFHSVVWPEEWNQPNLNFGHRQAWSRWCPYCYGNFRGCGCRIGILGKSTEGEYDGPNVVQVRTYDTEGIQVILRPCDRHKAGWIGAEKTAARARLMSAYRGRRDQDRDRSR